MAVRDIVQLKLQKRVLEEKLSQTNKACDKLSAILSKKTLSKSAFDLQFDRVTTTVNGLPVAEFRMPLRTSKALPEIRGKNDADSLDPSPITNGNIIRIRHHHLKRTHCKKVVNDVIKAKKDEAIRLEERNRPRKYPNVKIPESMLPNRYIRGELPCTIEHGISGHYLSWACPLENLDYDYYLPIFYDGLQCKEHPISFLARQGIEDLLFAARGHPERVIPCIKHLVRPLRNALGKFDVNIILAAAKAIQQLVSCSDGIGVALMPYSKQFLAPMMAFMDQNKNIGDRIDYGQRKNDDVGEEVRVHVRLAVRFP
jgi:Parkin co-regulated protein